MYTLSRTLGAVLLATLLAPSLHAQSFVGLGDLPGGFFGSLAFAVSDDGLVVVGRGANSANRPEGARWRDGGVQGLGYFDPVGGGTYNTPHSEAHGVSDGGTVVAGYSVYINSSTTGARQQAVRWAGGPPIQGLGFLPGGATSGADGVSADGTVIVGWSHTGSSIEPFRWENGQMQGLGHLPSAPSSPVSFAYDVSADGQVVVGRSGNASSAYQAFRWEDGQMQGLGFLLPGHTRSSAAAVSADGRVVVGNSNSRAFRWEDGQMDGLGLPATCSSSAQGVSGDGAVVVGTSQCPGIAGAFVWTADTGARSLQVVLESYGLDLTGWYLTSAHDVSADGRVVVGEGASPSGGSGEAWRAELVFVEEITVNDTGDEPDADADDGICDADAAEPGEQCTLRAAVETANAEAGEDRIVFDVGGDALGGVATIALESPLPPITEPVEIDAAVAPARGAGRRLP